MINYFELGADKQLNEIVFAGSHDAGITGGGANVQTQNLNILEQAQAGVRLFDLRIAAATVGGKFGSDKVAELKAFHADSKLMKNETKTRHLRTSDAPKRSRARSSGRRVRHAASRRCSRTRRSS